ncbi:hypothetical protein SASPL_118187 [Salvia splendens]|uniref:Retrotransposon gag domain-containing protein n=1 Tax=Salvia splendens TaxID=180675 RepID=A0A8X8XX92_SALSN|nr:hypothetical protein SASPL_118187 [Salvia splendens]
MLGLEDWSPTTSASDFRREFLNQFFPAIRANALRREIREVTQEYGESLNKYWHRYRSLLDACPNHNLSEVEIYSRFYDGMDAKSNDLVNSSSGGNFSQLRLSKVKIVLEKLLSAKRGYDDTSITPLQEKVKSTPTKDDDNLLNSRVDKLEEILQAIGIRNEEIPLSAPNSLESVDDTASLSDTQAMISTPSSSHDIIVDTESEEEEEGRKRTDGKEICRKRLVGMEQGTTSSEQLGSLQGMEGASSPLGEIASEAVKEM